MHDSAKTNFIKFADTYLKFFDNPKILELGSLDINGSAKELIKSKVNYIGVDLCSGKNVDVVLDDPYKFPFENESIDIVITTSTFEHIEFFWLTYLEILRILKPKGLFYLNSPTNGNFHRHPTDNWRFYPDSGLALKNWGLKNNYQPEVLESYVSDQGNSKGTWNDYVCVIVKNKKYRANFSARILDNLKNFRNGKLDSSNQLLNYNKHSQDHDNWGWHLYYKLRKFIRKLNFKNY